MAQHITVDQFTRDHLAAYCERVFPSYEQDTAKSFYDYAIAAVEDDPGLLDLGWPIVLRDWELHCQQAYEDNHNRAIAQSYF